MVLARDNARARSTPSGSPRTDAARRSLRHGLNIRFELIKTPADVTSQCRPKAGHLAVSVSRGKGVPALIAVEQDRTETPGAAVVREGVGAPAQALSRRTFKERPRRHVRRAGPPLRGTECAGADRFRVLTEAGYAPEIEYFDACTSSSSSRPDCTRGHLRMRTGLTKAEFGDYVSAPADQTETKKEIGILATYVRRVPVADRGRQAAAGPKSTRAGASTDRDQRQELREDGWGPAIPKPPEPLAKRSLTSKSRVQYARNENCSSRNPRAG